MRMEICERFGVEFPLFAFSHCRDVVAAVTNAGGFGVLGAVAYSPEQLDRELSWLDRQVHGRPYGVDVLVPGKIDSSAGDPDARLLDFIPEVHRDFVAHLFTKYRVTAAKSFMSEQVDPAGRKADEIGRRVTHSGATGLIDVALRHPIGLIASALGTPPPVMVDKARAAGVPVAALVGTVEHARRQVAAGADLIVAQGTEAGGHTGEVSTMVLVPQVVDAVAPVPVLAAGGIANGRQMAAALALGAEGVWCGSVWLTTEEAETAPYTKQKMISATSRDTIRSRSRTGKPSRQLKSDWTAAWEGDKSPGALPMPLQSLLSEPVMRRIDVLAEQGNRGAQELATYWVGQGVGLMNKATTVRDVIYEMAQDYAEAAERLNATVAD
jgi:NAD(P)H-dependent flavin oxidoreductase YrpB (nitropropane dioxygenase family)